MTCSTSKSAVTLVGILTLLVWAAPLAGQDSTTEGFTLGLHVGGVSIQAEDADRETGGGGGLILGYGLNRTVTVFARVDGANIELEDDVNVRGTWVMGHVDLGARIHFANPQRAYVPYLEGALTGRVVEVTELPQPNFFGVDKVSFSGGALTLSGGVMVYATETLAIDIGLLFSGGEFTEVTIGNTTQGGFDLDTQSTRLNIGVAWWL